MGERDEWLFLYYNTNNVEIKMHALLQCATYNDDRLEFYEYIKQNNIQNIQESSNANKPFIEIITYLNTGIL